MAFNLQLQHITATTQSLPQISSLTSPFVLFQSARRPNSKSLIRNYYSSSNTFADRKARHLMCHVTRQGPLESVVVSRRTANYPPSIFDYDAIQSLHSDFEDEHYASRIEKLKDYAKQLLNQDHVNLSAQLELIDTFQRLGLGFRMEKEIKGALNHLWVKNKNSTNDQLEDNLYSTSLWFRLMRQNGYMIPSVIFKQFKDDKGAFKACLSKDIKGILSLYEASYLALVGEDILDECRAFTQGQLKDCLYHHLSQKSSIDERLYKQVEHALDLPYHLRVPRLEARWFIDVYEKEKNMNPRLLELAKLDYNICQTKYQNELKAMSRWWKDLGLAEKLPFSRDRLAECFIWAVGLSEAPQYGHARERLTRVNQLVTTIDDIYDVYGSIDELELFTDVVERWDVNAIDELPEYMKLCFLLLFNTTNETGYEVHREQGCNIIPELKRQWTNLCKAYLVEAKWYYNGYSPTFEEYIINALASISGLVLLGNVYFTMGDQEISKEVLNCLKNNPDLIRWSSMIIRLCDDLGTSKDEMERGDVPKSIQCYMKEAGASEEVARQHIKDLIIDAWKNINEHVFTAGSTFTQEFVYNALGLGRMSHNFYHRSDGFGGEGGETLRCFKSLVVEPIPIEDL